MISAKDYAQRMLAEHTCIEDKLSLTFSGFRIQVVSNDLQIINDMREYFDGFSSEDAGDYDSRVYIFQSTISCPKLNFQDWTRDPSKQGRKDAFYDAEDGRFCWKVRTGMNYVLCDNLRIAYGPVLENFSQAINFTLSQHMEWLMNRGGLICHAAAIAHQNSGIALSAFSGGGKSTTALHLMNQGLDFVSNDRLFLRHHDNQTHMYGIAKQPRINPGTILNNKTLLPILSQQRINELKHISMHELWNLEEKYDAMLNSLYGKNRFQLEANIHAHVVLNWKHDSSENTRLEQTDINQREDLLEAIIKSPGPFYIDKKGNGWPNESTIDKQPYLEALSNIDVYEVNGKIDFDAMMAPLVGLIKKCH